MEITIRLGNVAKKIVFDQLHIKEFKDVLDMDYKSTGNVDKSKTIIFTKLIRGSIRIKHGLYRTKAEKEARIEQFEKLSLP